MFGKYRAVFTSRSKALAWAAGVCLTAYCTVPSADESEQPDQAAPHIGKHHVPKRHVNPWALQNRD